jgi:hypothetical protein
MTDEPAAQAVVARLAEVAAGSPRVTVDDVLSAYGRRSFGPALFLAAVAQLSPLGFVPGVTPVVAAFAFLVAAQMALGRPALTAPRALARRTLPHDRLSRALDRLRPWARRLDRVVGPRVERLAEPPWTALWGVTAACMAAAMAAVAVLPGAADLVAAPLAALGLGVAARDGVVTAGAAAVGWAGIAGALALAF